MRRLLVCFILGLLSQTSIAATSIAATSDSGIMLGINEGTAGQQGFADTQEKYQLLANYLGKTIKKSIKVESSQNLKSSADNLKKGRYALFFSKPSNVAATAIKDQNYELVAMAKGSFVVQFITNKDSGFKKPEDIRGKRIALAKNTFMEQAGLATLRDLKLTPAPQNIQPAKFQDAIAFMVEKKFADVGMVSPAIGKEWEKKGGTVLFESKKMPFWSIIAAPSVKPQDVAKLREILINMENSAEGKAVLAKAGIKGFVAGNKQEYLDLLTWLGNKP